MSYPSSVISNISSAVIECLEKKNKITKTISIKTNIGITAITSLYDISVSYKQDGLLQSIITTVTTNVIGIGIKNIVTFTGKCLLNETPIGWIITGYTIATCLNGLINKSVNNQFDAVEVSRLG